MLSPHLAVEIGQFQADCCVFVQKDDRVGVHLEDRRRPACRNRAFNQLTNGLSLTGTGSDQECFSGLHDGTEALSDAVGRNLRDVAIEETSVIAASLFGKKIDVSARGE